MSVETLSHFTDSCFVFQSLPQLFRIDILVARVKWEANWQFPMDLVLVMRWTHISYPLGWVGSQTCRMLATIL